MTRKSRKGQAYGTAMISAATPSQPMVDTQTRLLRSLTVPVCDDCDHDRPQTRADCIDGPRPCPDVACQYHLGIDVTSYGSIRVTWPLLQIGELLFCCALDVCDAYPDGLTLEQVGQLINLTRERIRQIEAKISQRLTALLAELR